MMRLSTVWRVDRTVDADGRNIIAEQILDRWEHEPGSARFFRSSANFVYTFRRRGSQHYLRFADDRERRRDGIEAEIILLTWLADRGLPVARPLPSRERSLVESVDTAAGTFHAVAFEALDGVERELDDLGPADLQEWGAALGRLHAATARYTGATIVRPTWRDRLHSARPYLPAHKPALRREFDSLAATLAALSTDQESYGIIHGDFELDNLRWSSSGIAMLDFDECAVHWYAADIAHATRDLFSDGDVDLTSDALRHFLRGYAEQHPLDPDLALRLPLFARLGRLTQYAALSRSLDLSEGREYPDWLNALIRKLVHRMAAYESSLDKHDRRTP